jgi:hypothetical protein
MMPNQLALEDIAVPTLGRVEISGEVSEHFRTLAFISGTMGRVEEIHTVSFKGRAKIFAETVQ